jgi:hypothetical protein
MTILEVDFNSDIKMINRRLYVPITLGDGHSTYVRIHPDDALVVTFRDRFNIASGKVKDRKTAEDIAAYEIASINSNRIFSRINKNG